MASLGLPGRVASTVEMLEGMADREVSHMRSNLIGMLP
jgi:hypothetical protein